MTHRMLSCLLALTLLLSLGGNALAQNTPASPPLPSQAEQPTALVYIPLSGEADLQRFATTGLPAYARLHGESGAFLLSGADAAGQQTLSRAGLTFQALDPDVSGAAYFLAYRMPDQPLPDLTAYGRLLFQDSSLALLRTSAAEAQLLSEAGLQLQAITLDPKPLFPPSTGATLPDQVTPDPIVEHIINQIDSNLVVSYTGNLSGEWPVEVGGEPYTIDSRNTYSGEDIQHATQYVGEHMANLGLDVEYHVWEGDGYPNVIGEIPGLVNPQDIFIIGAHLDDMPSGGRAPGADDNASGSVATLIAADLLSQYQWGCTLRFAFWTGEEQGLLGSYAYAQRSYQRDENIVAYLNLDMIAWNTANTNPTIDLHADSSLPPTLELAELFADVITAYNLDLDPEIVPDGTGASDHASFWQFGYTAILGIEDFSDFNPYYHTSSDDLDNLEDIPYYTRFVKAAIASFIHASGCMIPAGRLDGVVTSAGAGQPIPGVSVAAQDANGFSFDDITDETGYYTITLPAETYTVTAETWGYFPAIVPQVVVPTDTVTTLDITLDERPTHTVSGTVSDANTGWPLSAMISFPGTPLPPIYNDPATGFYSVALPEGLIYTFAAQPQTPGYLPASVLVGPIMADTTANIQLSIDAYACTAPHYKPVISFLEDFESGLGNWIASPGSLWHAEDQGDPCGAQVAPFPSPVSAVYYGDEASCNYDTGKPNQGSFTMVNPFSLPYEAPARLSIMSYEETECDGDCSVDNRIVEISINDGRSWTILGEGNTEGQWYDRQLNLAPYLGEEARLRFRFTTLDDKQNDSLGWLVDDIALITGCVPFEYGVNLLPAATQKDGPIGSSVTYNLSVENTGDISDTITLQTAGNLWPVLLSADTFQLAAGASAHFTASVGVPTSASVGDTDVLEILAESGADPGKTSKSVLTTRAVEPGETIFLPVIHK